MHLLEELHHRGPALGILDGGDKAPGFVEDEVAQAFGALQQLAIHADVVAGGIGLGAQLGDNFAVYLHAALLDHLLGLAAAGDAGLGQDLLQAFEFGWGTGFDFGLGVFGIFVSRLGFWRGFDRWFGCDCCFAVGLVSDGVYDLGFGRGF